MQQPPRLARAILVAASWLAPAGRRRQWRDRREFELWNWWALLAERGDLTPRRKREIYRHCFAAFPDALWARFDRDETEVLARRFYRGPIAALLAPILLIGLVAALTGGFAGLRAFYGQLPYSNPMELVFISQERTYANPHSVPQHAYAVWRDKAQSFQGIAGYIRYWPRVGGESGPVRIAARITPNLLSLLGVRPRLGRLLREGDTPDVAVLTFGFWDQQFGRDPNVIGREVLADGRPKKIVGVLSNSFPMLSEVAFLTPMVINLPWTRHLISAVARLKPGVTREAAEAEMLALLKAEKVRHFRKPALAPFTRRSAPLLGYGAGLLFAVAIGLAMVQVRKPGFALSHIPRSRARYWGFFAAKTTLLLVLVVLAWIEVSQAIRTRFESPEIRYFAGLLGTSVAFVVMGACAVYWSFYDQRSRCPECVQRLTLPVRMGSWSSELLDPVSTEMVCERGHGALSVPETQGSASVRERWTALDDSWKELFTK